MHLQHRPTQAASSLATPESPASTQQRAWPLIARIGWVTIAVIVLGLDIASLPVYYRYLHIVSGDSYYGPQLTPGDVRQLHTWGLTLDVYAWLNIGLFLLMVLVCTSIAILLFWRRSDDRMVLLASLSVLFIPLAFNSQITGALPSTWTLPTEVVDYLGSVCLGFFLFWFPSGRFAPRWAIWLMPVWLAYWVIQDLPLGPINNSFLPALPLFGFVACIIVFQVYRYRKVSTPLQRQQTKWVIFGIALSFGGIIVAFLVVDVLLPMYFTMTPLSFFFWQIPTDLLLLGFPLSIGFAISHNHLWEIDSLINLTLVYGLLTVLLGLMYLGLVIGLESLFGRFAGAHRADSVVLVVSTLLIAALFQPVRNRIQSLIDRRFYRRKYDAQKTLETFSASLRQETDLEELQAQLLFAVQTTMQPAHVALWLRPPDRTPLLPTHLREANGQTSSSPSRE